MNLAALTDAEQRLFSAILAGGASDAVACTAEGLKTEHFASAEARAIWSAIAACALQDRQVDVAGVAVRLGLDRQGCADIAFLDGAEPTAARRRQYCAEVIGDAKRRRVAAELAGAVESTERAASWSEAWEGVEPRLRAIQDAAADCRAHSLIEFIAEAKTALERNDRAGSIGSPFRGWDIDAGRIAGGDMAVLAARPGCGKTAFALMFADKIASEGKGVLFASLEMPGEQLVARLAMQRAGELGEIRTGCDAIRLANAKNARSAALDAIAKLDGRLVIGEPKDSGSLAQIEARATLLSQTRAGLGLVVIDYLQLLSVPADVKREPRERQVAEMSRRVKLMALALKVPVLLLAQLNREVEKDERRPRMSDLRESGAIEQDADRVWFLYTPKGNASAADASEVKVAIYQAKARHGSPGIECDLTFRRPQVRFYP